METWRHKVLSFIDVDLNAAHTEGAEEIRVEGVVGVTTGSEIFPLRDCSPAESLFQKPHGVLLSAFDFYFVFIFFFEMSQTSERSFQPHSDQEALKSVCELFSDL